MDTESAVSQLSHSLAESGRSWWMAMMLVDFRHAFWPWLVYTAAVFYADYLQTQFHYLIFLVLLLLSMSAVVALVNCADFSHGTISSLLTFPRERLKIWRVRLLFCAALLAFPVIASIPSYNGADVLAMVSMFAWCALTMGSVLAPILKKPLVTWTAILISPLVWIIICTTIIGAFDLDSDGSFKDEFPWAPTNFLIFFVIAGIAALAVSWRLWLRLEVRS